jgi:hypothetical protein
VKIAGRVVDQHDGDMGLVIRSRWTAVPCQLVGIEQIRIGAAPRFSLTRLLRTVSPEITTALVSGS